MYRRADMTGLVVVLALVHVYAVHALPHGSLCDVPAQTESGQVCGIKRVADDGSKYASFRGVPYAKQPLGELRFKELEPADPWDFLDATNEGPICPQTDKLYGRLMKPQGMDEACIHANIHVPIEALPSEKYKTSTEFEPPYQTTYNPNIENIFQLSRDLEPPYQSGEETATPGLPILVFIHGGGFAFGSGDSDLHGPEYLVSKKMIVITFNYRLNVFGFLSMNTAKIPGNAGLRDMVTLLRWVQKNAKYFGGDPDNVTLAGQSAGAVAAHLLTMSEAAEGLFKRAILMSGTGISNFYSPTQAFAQFISKQLFAILGITSTDPDEIHQQLIGMPVNKLIDANSVLLSHMGFTTFVPVLEIPIDGITPIFNNDPDILVAEGRGKDIPLLIGFTNSECETFRAGLEAFDVVGKIKHSPTLIVPLKTVFTTPVQSLLKVIDKVKSEYYNDTISVDNFIKCCTEGYYQYPALKLTEERIKTGGAPVFLYQFSYEGENSALKHASGQNFTGAGHIEDLTYIFKANSVVDSHSTYPPTNIDDFITQRLTNIVSNFMECSKPICSPEAYWQPAISEVQFQDIVNPSPSETEKLSPKQKRIIQFFDSLSSTN